MQKRKLSIFLSIDSCYNRIGFVDPDTLAMRAAMYRDFLYVLCSVIIFPECNKKCVRNI